MAKLPRKRRRDPLFELPGARANPIHAGQSRVWTAEGASAYSLGLDPATVTPQLAESLRGVSKRAREYFRRQDLIKQAIIVGELSEPLRPSAVVNWAKQIPLSFPKSIIRAIREIPLQQPHVTAASGGGGVDLRVHKSALIVLGCVIIDVLKFDRNAARNPATKKAKDAIEAQGLYMDDQTILDRMREACAEVDAARVKTRRD